MRNERAGLIEAGQLHAIAVILEPFEQRTGDSLGRRAGGIAGETAVDIHIFRFPQAGAFVHRCADGGRNDHHAFSGLNAARLFDLAQEGDQPCADIQLLHLVAAQRTDDGAGLFAFAKAIRHDVHVVPKVGRNGEQDILFHACSFLMRAMSVPG